jgi:subtilisin family serine protease
MNPLDLINLLRLMDLSSGNSNIKIGLIDGPVALENKDLNGINIQQIPENSPICEKTSSSACAHGTFVAGVLAGKRDAQAPAICPDCTLIVRPIFSERMEIPSASPGELSRAIIDCVDSGAIIINMSLALTQHSKGQQDLKEALDYSAKKGVLIVTAAGNHGSIGSTIITRHPWVISVVACNLSGSPMQESNLGCTIGRWGLMAPGSEIISLKPEGGYTLMNGTSVAAPFVSGAIGLLWSLIPHARAGQMRSALIKSNEYRKSIVPPLLDAWKAYQFLLSNY